MKKFLLILTLTFLCSFVSFADIFNEKDSFNVSVGLETQKCPSGILDLNYQFEPDEKLYVQVGTQSRIMNGWDDYQSTYVGLLLDFDNFVFDKEYTGPSGSERIIIKDKEHKFYLLLRTGISNSLDSNEAGLYAATGIQYGMNRYVRIMFEAEDGKFRNSFVIGMKFDSLKFY